MNSKDDKEKKGIEVQKDGTVQQAFDADERKRLIRAIAREICDRYDDLMKRLARN